LSSFCVILLTKSKQTDADYNIISLVEIMTADLITDTSTSFWSAEMLPISSGHNLLLIS